jgi:predicted DNA-binding WGR domain protein
VEGEPLACKWIRMRWEKATRYYEVHLHPDLWGQWILTKVWGRRGERLGGVKHTPCQSYQEGQKLLANEQARRQQRGYILVLDHCSSG